jgi:hypothetical protein
MPVYSIVCPDCGHTSKSLVLAGCRMPSEWACSSCNGRRAQPHMQQVLEPHPWESGHGAGCLCCGDASALGSTSMDARQGATTTRKREACEAVNVP